MRSLSELTGRRLYIDIEWLVALGASLIFAYFIATEFWLGAAAIVGMIALALMLMSAPLAIAVIWITGMPTLFILGDNAVSAIPFLTLGRAFFLILMGWLLLRFLLATDTLHPADAVEKSMAALLLVIAVSWSLTLGDKIPQVVRNDIVLLIHGFLMPFAAFLVGRNSDWTERKIKTVLWIFVVYIGLYMIAAGVMQHFLNWTFFAPNHSDSLHPDRMTATFTNALEFGVVVTTVLCVAVLLLVHTKARTAQFFLFALIAGLALCTVMSQGRGAWLAVLLALAYIGLKSPRTRGLLALGTVLCVLAGLVLLPVIAETDDLTRRLQTSSTLHDRVGTWATSINMIIHKPLFGFGFGSDTFYMNKSDFYDAWGQLSRQVGSYGSLPHNEFLHVAVLMGIVGLVPYVCLLVILWRTASGSHERARDRRPFDADLAIIAQAGLIILIVNGLFLDLSPFYYGQVPVFFLLGIVARKQLPTKRTADRPRASASQASAKPPPA